MENVRSGRNDPVGHLEFPNNDQNFCISAAPDIRPVGRCRLVLERYHFVNSLECYHRLADDPIHDVVALGHRSAMRICSRRTIGRALNSISTAMRCRPVMASLLKSANDCQVPAERSRRDRGNPASGELLRGHVQRPEESIGDRLQNDVRSECSWCNVLEDVPAESAVQEVTV